MASDESNIRSRAFGTAATNYCGAPDTSLWEASVLSSLSKFSKTNLFACVATARRASAMCSAKRLPTGPIPIQAPFPSEPARFGPMPLSRKRCAPVSSPNSRFARLPSWLFLRYILLIEMLNREHERTCRARASAVSGTHQYVLPAV